MSLLLAFQGAQAAALDGNIAAQSSVAGSLTTSILLVGNIPAQSATAGSLTTQILLVGNIPAVSTWAATELKGAPAALAGGITAASIVAGDLTTQILLAGTVTAASTIAGALTTEIRLAGAIVASSTIAGELTTEILLTGNIVGQSDWAGDLAGAGAALAGGITAASEWAGELTVITPTGLEPDIFFPPQPLDSRGQPVYAASMYNDLVRRYGLFEGERIYYAMAREKKGPFGDGAKYEHRRPATPSVPAKPQLPTEPLPVDRVTAAVPPLSALRVAPPPQLPKAPAKRKH